LSAVTHTNTKSHTHTNITRRARRNIANSLVESFRRYYARPELLQYHFGYDEGACPLPFDLSRKVLEKFRASTLTPHEYSPFAFDVSCNVWERAGSYYLIPYRDRTAYEDDPLAFLAEHPDLEVFAYWNNSDRPETISPHAWACRSRVWSHLTEDAQFYGRRLVLELFSPGMWHQLSPVWGGVDWGTRLYEIWQTPEELIAYHRAAAAEIARSEAFI
jgi:hypothetical protein